MVLWRRDKQNTQSVHKHFHSQHTLINLKANNKHKEFYLFFGVQFKEEKKRQQGAGLLQTSVFPAIAAQTYASKSTRVPYEACKLGFHLPNT